MAERRMVAKSIIDTDAFLDMPATAQNLYFHLLLRADDDGFVQSPKSIKRLTGSSDDDVKLLIAKSFILTFESGVIVIKHWRIHNCIRKDMYKPTVCEEEASHLLISQLGEYSISNEPVTDSLRPCNEPVTDSLQFRHSRLGKVRLGKDSTGKVSTGKVSKGKVSKDNKVSKEKEKEVITRVTINPPYTPPTGGKGESEKNSDDIIGEGPKAEECEPPKREQSKTREPPETKYAEFVQMTEEEHEKLVEEYGEDGTAECIAILDNYKGSTGKRYKSDYRAILSWVVERYKERHMAKPIARPKQQRDLSEILQELRGGQHED